MTTAKTRARFLLREWDKCMMAKPKNPSVDLTIERDHCAPFAYQLNNQYAWGDDDKELIEACDQLEVRMHKLKEKLIFEVLKNGI
jgi:hypothetical protein